MPDDCINCNRIKIFNDERIKNKYIILNYNGKITIKHMEATKFQNEKKLYRHYKNIDLNIEYYPQYKEFVKECKEKDYKIIEYNDF